MKTTTVTITTTYRHGMPSWLETIGILGGLVFVAICLFVVLYIFVEITTGARQERKANNDLEEYVDETTHGKFFADVEEARNDFS